MTDPTNIALLQELLLYGKVIVGMGSAGAVVTGWYHLIYKRGAKAQKKEDVDIQDKEDLKNCIERIEKDIGRLADNYENHSLDDKHKFGLIFQKLDEINKTVYELKGKVDEHIKVHVRS